MRRIISASVGLAGVMALSVLGAVPAQAATAPTLAITAPAPVQGVLTPAAPTTHTTGTMADGGGPPLDCKAIEDPLEVFFGPLEKLPIPGLADAIKQFLGMAKLAGPGMEELDAACGMFESGGVPNVGL